MHQCDLNDNRTYLLIKPSRPNFKLLYPFINSISFKFSILKNGYQYKYHKGEFIKIQYCELNQYKRIKIKDIPETELFKKIGKKWTFYRNCLTLAIQYYRK